LLYQLAQSPHLERRADVLALVAVQKLVPRVGLNTASVLCVSPVGLCGRRTGVAARQLSHTQTVTDNIYGGQYF